MVGSLLLTSMLYIPVSFQFHGHNITVEVSRDYSDISEIGKDNYFYIPFSGRTAVQFATKVGEHLPTPEIVDATYINATCKLRPRPMNPGDKDAYLKHSLIIVNQRAKCKDSTLLAGHKKDVVVSNRLGKTAIYGWHKLNGKPIQPYSTIHGENYWDYSHGLRLVKDRVIIDGKVKRYIDFIKLKKRYDRL